MKRKYKVLLSILAILILIASGIFVYCKFFKTNSSSAPINTIKVTNSIDKYGYTLEDRDTALFKEKFEELKTLLNKEDYDKEEYVKLISQLFIIDLYTIDNKISRYDVGGMEYVYSKAQSSLKSVAENSLYKTVENNLDNTRTQSLPLVSDITVDDISSYDYTMPDDSEVSGYRVKLSWTYKTNMGYDTKGTLVLIPEGEKYGVVYFNS